MRSRHGRKATATTAATAALSCLVLLFAACGGDDDGGDASTTSTTAAAGATGTSAPDGTSGASTTAPALGAPAGSLPDAAPDGNTLSFVTDDGTVDIDLTGVTCTPGSGGTGFTMSGGKGTTVEAQVEGQRGDLTLAGEAAFTGSVDSVRLGQGGNLVASGSGSQSGSGQTGFTLAGECVSGG